MRPPAVNDLEAFFERNKGHVIHKWLHYFEIYNRHLAPLRDSAPTVVEVGVAEGGSLMMWRDFFGEAGRIIGIDVNANALDMQNEGFEILIGDQASPDFWASVREIAPDLNVLIDDGGHRVDQQRVTFQEMFPHLANNGVYICEDLHTSYWSDFGGGLRSPESFIEFAKGLIDEMHAWWLRDRDPAAVTHLTRTLNSLHFYDSMLVIEKRERRRPVSRKTGKPRLSTRGDWLRPGELDEFRA